MTRREIEWCADFAFEIQGNVEDSLKILEDELNPFDLEVAEGYLIEKYGEPEGWN